MGTNNSTWHWTSALQEKDVALLLENHEIVLQEVDKGTKVYSSSDMDGVIEILCEPGCSVSRDYLISPRSTSGVLEALSAHYHLVNKPRPDPKATV